MKNKINFAQIGFLLISLGVFLYLIGVLVSIPRVLFMFDNKFLRTINVYAVLYSGFPVIFGTFFLLTGLFFTRTKRRVTRGLRMTPISDRACTVVLTAYNDELSIADSVRDFLEHPDVRRVLVISNNSTDRTEEEAEKAGAEVFNEKLQGYGACVYRALQEASKPTDTPYIVVCEGDMTFRAFDLEKLFAYMHHADFVCGSRTSDPLQRRYTQLSTFMHYGNTFVAKLLEIKHIGRVTLSDVGTTYKLCRTDAVRRILPLLDPRVNLEFNPYIIDTILDAGMDIVECPITFHPRVGVSKGGNINDRVAFKLGIKMIKGIMFGWKADPEAGRKAISALLPTVARAAGGGTDA